MTKSLEQIVTRTATSPLEIGQRLEDGTIYAGISPDTGKPIFASSADAPLTMTWREALNHAELLNHHSMLGYQDWRLPTQRELHVLFENREKGALSGTFSHNNYPKNWYWSSTKDDEVPGVFGIVRFWDGDKAWTSQKNSASVRLVRSELGL